MGRNGHEGESPPFAPPSFAPSPSPPSPGRVGGRYRLVAKLGTGGMSEVWRGYDERLGRSVAVKVLSPRLAEDQGFRDRLRQEAVAAARLGHPHITGIYDFGEAPLNDRLTVPYVVMELNEGDSVAARLARLGPMRWRDAVTMATEVAAALATAHAHGVVHRDVTPANVMLTPAGAKVVDFGISALVGQRDAAPDGSLLGTPAYLAPERLGGAQVSAPTDVYALGLLLYRALTGRLPWPADTTSEALRAHLYADPEPLPPTLPAAVREMCLRCLAKDPSNRPSAAEMSRLLGEEVGLHPVLPTLPPSVPQPFPPSVLQPFPSSVLPPPSPSPAVSSSFPRPAQFLPGLAGRVKLPRWRPPPRVLAPFGRIPGAGRPSLGLLRLRAGMRLGRLIGIGAVRPLGGGLFAGRACLGRIPLSVPQLGLFDGGSAALTSMASPRPSMSSPRRRMQAAAVVATLVGTITVGWSLTRDPPPDHQAQAAGTGVGAGANAGADAGAGAAGVAAPSASVCAVRYQLRRDSGSAYEALLTVAATDEVAASPWRVQFSYPGSQRLTGSQRAVVQKGRRVVAKGRGRLQTFTLRGAYRGYNLLPVAFTLDGHRCRAEVLGGVLPAADIGSGRGATTGAARRDRPPRKSSTPQKLADRSQSRTSPATPPADPAPGVPISGVPIPGMPMPGMPMPGMPAPGMPAPGMPAPGFPAPELPAPELPAPAKGEGFSLAGATQPRS